MPSYDPVEVRRLVADSDATSSGFTFPVLVHKVVVIGGTDTATSFDIQDNVALGAVTASIVVKSAAALFGQQDFNPPVALAKGMSVDVTGSGCIAFIYYTRR